MLKRILSVFVALCALLCALPTDVSAARASANTYYVEVDITNQITTVYRRSNRTIVRQMICSTGTDNRTPRGTFKLQKTRESTDRKPWYYISTYSCYVKYATRIKGGILFHSIPYTAKDMNAIDKTALSELGRKASHGCVRLRWQDARWIAQNCPDGTTVKIFNGAAKKEALRKLLLKEGYTEDCGLTYQQFLESDFAEDGTGGMGRGSIGESVTALQSRLIGLGFFSGLATGVYDNATIVAVMRYQAASGLTVNGVASKALIEQVMVEEDLIAEYATLVPGTKGPLVAKYQDAMRAVGFFEGATDGVYGDSLSNAVNTYCRCMGIEDKQQVTPAIRADVYKLRKTLNSRFGEGNYALLLLSETVTDATTKQKATMYAKATSSSKKVTTVPKSTAVTFIERSSAWCKVQYGKKKGYIIASRLKLTSYEKPVAHWGLPVNALGETDMSASSLGEGVVALQDRLRDLGFFPGESTPLYDGATEEAVRVYQSAAGLEATGAASVAVQQALMTSDAITGQRVTLSSGAQSAAVAALQRTLKALQYYSGECDGRFNSATGKAVSLFATTNGMADTRTATPEVQQAIFNQYLDCEAKYGSGNYVLSFETVETRMATAKAKTTLRKAASVKSKALATLKKGDAGTALVEGKNWVKVNFNGKRGYVRAGDVKLSTRTEKIAVFNAPAEPNESAIAYGEEESPAVDEPELTGEETPETGEEEALIEDIGAVEEEADEPEAELLLDEEAELPAVHTTAVPALAA